MNSKWNFQVETPHTPVARGLRNKSEPTLASIFLLHIPGESRRCEHQCNREGSEPSHCTWFGLCVTAPCGSPRVRVLQFTQFIASLFASLSCIRAHRTKQKQESSRPDSLAGPITKGAANIHTTKTKKVSPCRSIDTKNPPVLW